jgi:hypothetical protein
VQIQDPRQHMIDNEMPEGGDRNIGGREHTYDGAALGIDEEVSETVKA